MSFLATLKKQHADGEIFGQFNSLSASGLPEENFRSGDQQPGAVAAASVCIHAAAMGQAGQGMQTALHHGMRCRPAQLGDETDAACVMIVRECEATFRHVTCLAGTFAKVQSSFLMRQMDFSAPCESGFPEEGCGAPVWLVHPESFR